MLIACAKEPAAPPPEAPKVAAVAPAPQPVTADVTVHLISITFAQDTDGKGRLFASFGLVNSGRVKIGYVSGSLDVTESRSGQKVIQNMHADLVKDIAPGAAVPLMVRLPIEWEWPQKAYTVALTVVAVGASAPVGVRTSESVVDIDAVRARNDSRAETGVPAPGADRIEVATPPAAVTSATATVAPAQFQAVPTTQPSEWQQLEAERKKRDDDYVARLASTSVYVTPGGSEYHTAGCDALWVVKDVRNGYGHREYEGQRITLQDAADRHLAAHTGCGAPSYAFSYH